MANFTNTSCPAEDLLGAVRVSLNAVVIRLMLVGFLVVSMLCAVATWQTIVFSQEKQLPWAEWPLSQKLLLVFGDLALENTVSVWFSSMLLLLIGLVFLVCFAAEPRGADRSALAFGWLIVAIVFFGLSLDEMGSLHEKISLASPDRGWRFMMLAFVAVIPIYMGAFGLAQLRRSPRGVVLILLGVVLFVSIPFFEHFEMLYVTAKGTSLRANHGLWLALEEGAELLGMIAFLAGALAFAATFAPAAAVEGAPAVPWLEFRVSRARLRRTLTTVFVVLVIGMLAALRWDPETTMDGVNGHPENWFASAALFAAASFLLTLPRSGAERRIAIALALSATLVSAFVGANLRVFFWVASSEWLQWSLIGATLLSVLVTALANVPRDVRLLGVLSGVGLATALAAAPHDGVAPWGLFAAGMMFLLATAMLPASPEHRLPRAP